MPYTCLTPFRALNLTLAILRLNCFMWITQALKNALDVLTQVTPNPDFRKFVLRPSLTEGSRENVRFRTTNQSLILIDPKTAFFRAIFSGYPFRDGLHPDIEPHFRTTSASETGVWTWVSTHRWRHKRRYDPINSSTAVQAASAQYCCVPFSFTHASGITTSR